MDQQGSPTGCTRHSAAQARLDASGGPYLGGEQLSAYDLALAPRLHHVFSALPALKVHISLQLPCRLRYCMNRSAGHHSYGAQAIHG